MRGAHSPCDGGAGWGSPGTLSPSSRPPPAPVQAPSASWPQASPWSGCRQGPRQLPPGSGLSLGGEGVLGLRWGAGGPDKPGPGRGRIPAPRACGEGVPRNAGRPGQQPAGRAPGTSCLARGHRAVTTICVPALLGTPRAPRPPSAQAPRPALQDADQTRPVPLLAGPGTAGRPVSAAHCVHPRLPRRAVCVRTRGPRAYPPRKQRRAGDQVRVGAWPWASLLDTGWALWGGPHAARPAGSGDEIMLRAGGSQVGTGTRPHPPGLAALGLVLAAPGHTETLLAWGRRGFRCRLQERGPRPAYPLL